MVKELDQVVFVDERYYQHAAVVVAVGEFYTDIKLVDGGEVWQVPNEQVQLEEDFD